MGKDLPKICFDCGDIKPFGENNWFSRNQDEKRYDSLSKEYFGEFIQDSCSPCVERSQIEMAELYRTMRGN